MKILLDTNILVYSCDPAHPLRHTQAIELLDRLHILSIGRLSSQALAEFMNVVIRPFHGMPPRLTVNEAISMVQHFINHFEVYPLTPLTVLEAGRGVRDHQMAYYDAQVWATARLHQVSALFSEDFTDGATLEGVRFINPFAPHFRLDDWVLSTEPPA
jgi:predicted nucleic acid-binding protein